MKTRRTWPGYASSICLRTGVSRPQKGHWKSENSTTVTGASAAPREGCPSVVSLTGAEGAAAAPRAAGGNGIFAGTVAALTTGVDILLIVYHPPAMRKPKFRESEKIRIRSLT